MFGILGAVILLVGGCTALIALSIDGDNEELVSIPTSTIQTVPANEQELDEQTSEDQGTTGSVEEGQATSTSELDDVVSCTRVDEDTIVLEIVNNSPKTSSYLLTVGFFDDAGQRLADEPSTVSYLRPGERAIEEHFVFEEQGTACEVIDVNRFAAESVASEVAEVSLCQIGAEPDVLGDFQATLSVTNDSPKTSNYSIEVAFVDPAGIRRGTGTAFIEAVRTDETAPSDVFSTATFADGYTCQVVGVTRNAT